MIFCTLVSSSMALIFRAFSVLPSRRSEVFAFAFLSFLPFFSSPESGEAGALAFGMSHPDL